MHTAEQLTARWPYRRDPVGIRSPPSARRDTAQCRGLRVPGRFSAIHPASVQLIGIPIASYRRFGFCGNDFAAVALLPDGLLDEIDEVVTASGRMLASKGYVGAFGADLLVDGEQVYLTEINPRFQGSTAVSVGLAATVDEPDIVLDHLASFLGIEPRPRYGCANGPGSLLHGPNSSATTPRPVTSGSASSICWGSTAAWSSFPERAHWSRPALPRPGSRSNGQLPRTA